MGRWDVSGPAGQTSERPGSVRLDNAGKRSTTWLRRPPRPAGPVILHRRKRALRGLDMSGWVYDSDCRSRSAPHAATSRALPLWQCMVARCEYRQSHRVHRTWLWTPSAVGPHTGGRANPRTGQAGGTTRGMHTLVSPCMCPSQDPPHRSRPTPLSSTPLTLSSRPPNPFTPSGTPRRLWGSDSVPPTHPTSLSAPFFGVPESSGRSGHWAQGQT